MTKICPRCGSENIGMMEGGLSMPIWECNDCGLAENQFPEKGDVEVQEIKKDIKKNMLMKGEE